MYKLFLEKSQGLEEAINNLVEKTPQLESLPRNKGILISLEGINCSGKSTQKSLIKKLFTNMDYSVFIVPQQKDDFPFQRISERGRGTYLTSNPLIDTLDWAAYITHQYELSLQSIVNSDVVIFDRYKHCIEVYQVVLLTEYLNMERKKAERWLNSLLAHLPNPDLSFFLNITNEEMKKRYKKRYDSRGGRAPLTEEDIRLTERIKKEYFAREDLDIINGDDDPAHITEIIYGRISDYLKRK